ncbi:MAG: 4Fe-4S binding protein [Chitinivibrionales bacterium]|nr:4Fe-4S binding protein [Chitinivibrionales bacterium]
MTLFQQQRRVILSIALGVTFLSTLILVSCSITPSSNKEPAGDIEWISVKTGYVDTSFANPTDQVKFEQFIKMQYEKHFSLRWKRSSSALNYQIRCSQKPIDGSNWSSAVLCATIDQSDEEEMQTIVTVKPDISKNLCTGCQVCVSTCPQNAIRMEGNKAIIDLTKCTGCGVCFKNCTFKAITDRTFGKFYYFAIRAFSKNNIPSIKTTSTDRSYKIKHKNWEKVCGRCGAGCHIYETINGLPGCPVDAIKYYTDGDKKDLVYIDETKCINCGNCLRKCFMTGNLTMRRQVVASE